MAWMATHLYVRCDSAEPVASAVEQLLQGEEHRRELTDFDELPGPVVVWPPHRGWVAVTGAAAWIDDLGWAAERLSAACDALALSCEVFGNCYQLRLAIYEGGEARRQLRAPTEETDVATPMPLYDDVEQRAFETLREQGLPPALIAVGTDPFGDPPRLELGAGITLLRRDEQLERGQIPVELPDLPSETDAPVLPTRIGRDFGLMIFEDRYVEGVPADAALARLFELEQAYNERAHRANAGGELSTTFTYYAGSNQLRLDAMLQAHERHTLPHEDRFRPPWWAFWKYFGKWK